MTDKSNNNRPEYRIFLPSEDENAENKYIVVGATWSHSKGGGFNIKFDTPLLPDLVAFPNQPKKD